MPSNHTILVFTIVRVAVLVIAAVLGYSSVTHEGELAQIAGAISAAVIALMTWLSVRNQQALRDTDPNGDDDFPPAPPAPTA